MQLSLYNNTRYGEVAASQMRSWLLKHVNGRNEDVDTGTDPEDVWNAASKAATQTLLTTAAAMSISTSAAGDNGESMTVVYLDTNWNIQTAVVTFDATDGRNEEPTTITAVRILEMYNHTATAYVGDAYIYETSDTVTGGVPDTATKTHGKIEIGAERMQSTHYTIPAGYTGQIISGYVAENSDSGFARFGLYIRPYGDVFQVQHEIGVNNTGSSFATIPLTAPIHVPEKADIKIVCNEVEADDTDVSAGYQLILIPNP